MACVCLFDCFFLFFFPQRLLRMVDGLNFKDFVAFLSAFSPQATLDQKIECKTQFLVFPPFFVCFARTDL